PGEVAEGVDLRLKWRAGREAASHMVYLGTHVEDLALLGTTDECTFDVGLLDYDTIYYWCVTETNDAGMPAVYAGDVWSFSTPTYRVVDDFEAYDDECNALFFTWLDGLGHSGAEDCGIEPYRGNGTGSMVGNDITPFAEQTIVYSDQQSMPLLYFRTSETSLSFPAEDWTAGGLSTLSLRFHGAPNNAGQLYLKINDTKVIYDGDATDIKQALWQPWLIDLDVVGADLQNVTQLTIGIDGPIAAGKLYFDDIRIYP
ncbi:MAG: hypothetical protein HQ515_18785, partial [Phycisphaeraceae bacterium]|nr:hypothetical protein [Phycisphaeraceae bacterium]